MPRPNNSIDALLAITAQASDQIMLISEAGYQRYLQTQIERGHGVRKFERAAATTEQHGAVSVFRLEGVLVQRAEWYDECDGTALAEQILAASRDENVKSGILFVESPGGQCAATPGVAAAIDAFAAAKPIVTQVGQCCCSAAYWLAARTHKIYAGPTSEVGNIGVKSLLYDFSEYFKEMGVLPVDTTTGAIKSIGTLGTPVTDAQREFLRERVDFWMAKFKTAVITGRQFTDEEWSAVSDGRWAPGEVAITLRLIDAVQLFHTTLSGLSSGGDHSKKGKVKAMSHTADTDNTPKAATLAELKKNFPKASAEFREAQLEAGATLAEAGVNYANTLQADLDKANAATTAAEDRADKAEKTAATAATAPGKGTKTTPAKKVDGLGTGAKSQGESEEEEASGGGVDYRAMAQTLAKERSISYRAACQEIKRRHPEARAAFIGKPLPG